MGVLVLANANPLPFLGLGVSVKDLTGDRGPGIPSGVGWVTSRRTPGGCFVQFVFAVMLINVLTISQWLVNFFV